MEAKDDDEIIEVFRSEHRTQFETGLLVGGLIGLWVMYLIFNIL